jgi:hypothetical protein
LFAGLILIPAIRRDRETEFRRWYHWSSGYAEQLGLSKRSLLRERGGQGYAILEEHAGYDHLLAMINHPFRQAAQKRVAPLLEGDADSRFYYTMLNRGANGVSRFVNLVFFPPLREGKDVEFRQWFWKSGACCAQLPEVHRRRLLWPLEGGSYAGLVEYDGHHDQARGCAGEWPSSLLDGDPHLAFFEKL